jgi:hypothetical protein
LLAARFESRREFASFRAGRAPFHCTAFHIRVISAETPAFRAEAQGLSLRLFQPVAARRHGQADPGRSVSKPHF